MKVVYFKSKMDSGLAVISTKFEMPDVSANLYLTYKINNQGEMKITQILEVDSTKKVSNMFRFGMTMCVDKDYDKISFYGRGPVENYADRNNNSFLGIYNQTVDEQFYPYIRPQENGNKTDIRWWKLLNSSGYGLQFVSDEGLSMSALFYNIESMDDGTSKKQSHPADLPKTDYINLCIDKVQAGLGCVNSWNDITQPRYQLPYQNYEYNFVIKPVFK
jgi:beta-galactosidase